MARERDSGDYSVLFPGSTAPEDLRKSSQFQAGKLVELERGYDILAEQVERIEEDLVDHDRRIELNEAAYSTLAKATAEHVATLKGFFRWSMVCWIVLFSGLGAVFGIGGHLILKVLERLIVR